MEVGQSGQVQGCTCLVVAVEGTKHKVVVLVAPKVLEHSYLEEVVAVDVLPCRAASCNHQKKDLQSGTSVVLVGQGGQTAVAACLQL
jgi:hypothetical protein